MDFVVCTSMTRYTTPHYIVTTTITSAMVSLPEATTKRTPCRAVSASTPCKGGIFSTSAISVSTKLLLALNGQPTAGSISVVGTTTIKLTSTARPIAKIALWMIWKSPSRNSSRPRITPNATTSTATTAHPLLPTLLPPASMPQATTSSIPFCWKKSTLDSLEMEVLHLLR